MNKIIYKDEDMYGFIEDIVEEFKGNIKLAIDNEDYNETSALIEGLNEAISIREDSFDERFYKVWYNPMGAYIFEEMKIVEEEKNE